MKANVLEQLLYIFRKAWNNTLPIHKENFIASDTSVNVRISDEEYHQTYPLWT